MSQHENTKLQFCMVNKIQNSHCLSTTAIPKDPSNSCLGLRIKQLSHLQSIYWGANAQVI